MCCYILVLPLWDNVNVLLLQVFSRPEAHVKDIAVLPSRALLPMPNETASVLWPKLSQLAQEIRAGIVTCDDQ